MKPYILISSYLIGLNTRYDHKSNFVKELQDLVKSGKAIYFCPEQAGGLCTPRPASEIEANHTAKDVLNGKAKVFTVDGKDVTEQYIKGAEETLALCLEFGIKIAILKERSPSCGSNQVYDGTFSKNRIAGKGITAELLSSNGIQVYSEENFPKNI